MTRFEIVESIELGAFAVGAGLLIFGALDDRPTLEGVGVGLGIEAAVMLGLDFLAHTRAQPYTAALRAFRVALSRDGVALSLELGL